VLKNLSNLSTPPSILQLHHPDMIAVGNSEVVNILRDADVPDDHIVARLARLFAQGEGLVLHRYQRDGVDPSDPGSYEVYVRRGVEDLPDMPRWDPDLGSWFIQQGTTRLPDEQAIVDFLRRWGT
jgi:hypothetical protein